MSDDETAAKAVAYILESYPSLGAEEAVTFLHICAEDGLSLRSLAKRRGLAQSTVARHVSDLAGTGGHGLGLVMVCGGKQELRHVVRLTAIGLEFAERLAGLPAP